MQAADHKSVKDFVSHSTNHWHLRSLLSLSSNQAFHPLCFLSPFLALRSILTTFLFYLLSLPFHSLLTWVSALRSIFASKVVSHMHRVALLLGLVYLRASRSWNINLFACNTDYIELLFCSRYRRAALQFIWLPSFSSRPLYHPLQLY